MMKKRKYRLKQRLALLLAAAVAWTGTEALTLSAWAKVQNGGRDGEAFTESVIPEDELPEQNELLEGYLYQRAYEGLGEDIALYGNAGAVRLTGDEKAIYEALKAHVKKIAAGDETTAKVTVDGFTSLKGAQVGEAARRVISYLLMDCPYDLYWYDKTAGYEISWGPRDNEAIVSSLTFSLKASEDYQGSNIYTVDRSKTSAVDTAADTAQSIVKKYENESDYNKLKAYLKEINNRTAYNNTAAAGGAAAYGNPWQLIWVFDGNPNTNVVCEGYSKAFQYLCDLSFFTNAACYTVTGTMNGGQGAGSHMWNIVVINGESYLVDVTNCDAGTVGAPDKLFLAGTPGSVENGYAFSFNNGQNTVTYQYDKKPESNQYGLLGDILILSDKPYEENSAQELTIQAPKADEVMFGASVDSSILRGGLAANANNQPVPGKFMWAEEVASYGEAGKKSLKAVFVPDSAGYPATNVLVEVTVKRKPVTVAADPQSKAYGQSDPELTYTAEGLVDGYPLNGLPERQPGEGIGSYKILQGGLTDQQNPNYIITYKESTLEISAGECIVSVNERQNIRPGTGEFIEPRFTDADGNLVEGTLTYTYGSKTYSSYETLKAELAKLPEDRSGVIAYTFKPKNSDYQEKNGTIEFTVKLIEFLVGNAPATADNALTIKSDAVYGDAWTDIVKIGSITTKVGEGTDSASEHFTLSRSGIAKAGMGQSFQVLYNGTIDGKAYTNELVCSGTVDVKKRTVTVSAGTCKISKVYDKTRDPGTAKGELAIQNLVPGDEEALSITVTPEAYGNPNVSGQGKVSVTLALEGSGAGNYELGGSTLEIPGEIMPKAITPAVSVSGSYSYTGSPVIPTLTVADGSDVLAQSDYDMVLSDNRGAGTAKVSVKPKAGGNYTWSPAAEASFTIDKGSYTGTKTMSVSAKCGASASFSISSLLPAGYKLGAVRAEDRDQIFTGTPALNGANISYHLVNDNTKAGKTAVIIVPVTESTDFQAFDVTITMTALAADQNSGSGSNNSNNNNNNNNSGNNNNGNNNSGSGSNTNTSDNIQYSLSMETGISQVPQAFGSIESLNTAEKIEAQMKQELQKKAAGVTQDRIVVYDVVLMVNINNAGWKTADKDNFPKEGLTVTIPYPAGTDRNRHDFIVSHMFTEEMNGHKPGEIEYPSVTKTEDGLQFKVNGLSPISVGWAETGKLNTASKGTGVNSPKTADASPVLAYLLLMLLSAAVFAGALWGECRKGKR